MSLITAFGADAKKSATTQNVDFKIAMIRLKENESVRVRLLDTNHYVEYMAHGDFNLGIRTQPCSNSEIGGLDPMCIAAKSGIEEFKKLSAKKRYVFALYDIDAKQVRYWDCSKQQATKMISDIEEYADSIDSIAFNFKRVGTKKDTAYSLNPILKKLDSESQQAFDNAVENAGSITPENFLSVLVPHSVEKQIEELASAGFPVEEYFGVKSKEDAEPVNVETDENPLDVM